MIKKEPQNINYIMVLRHVSRPLIDLISAEITISIFLWEYHLAANSQYKKVKRLSIHTSRYNVHVQLGITFFHHVSNCINKHSDESHSYRIIWIIDFDAIIFLYFTHFKKWFYLDHWFPNEMPTIYFFVERYKNDIYILTQFYLELLAYILYISKI